MEFKLSDGPWSTLFKGEIQGHALEVIANPAGLILAIVYESADGKKTGLLVQCYKVFLAKGNLEGFIDTLPRKAILLEKHSENQTNKFLLLDSGMTYSAYEENAAIQETDALMAKIRSFSSLVREVSTAYDIDLLDLENASDEEKMAFHSIPLVGLLISPAVKRKESAMRIEMGHGEIMLGITKKGAIVKEPFDFFDRVMVSGGGKGDRMHLFHVLIESALLSNIPATVIDWGNSFSGLKFPNENAEELKKYKVDLDRLGFPLTFYSVGQDLKADLNHIAPAAFLEAFGLAGTPQGVIIEQAMGIGKSGDIAKLIDRVNEIPEGEHVTPFKKREVIRILALIENIYPKLFSGANPIKQISQGWVRGIGRANIVLLEKNDLRKNFLVLQSVVRGLLAEFKAMGKSSGIKALLFLSEGNMVVPQFKGSSISGQIAADLAKAREYGLGFVIETKDKVNIAKEVKDQIQCSLAVIQGNDVGVSVKNRKNYRVLVRPGLSKCTETRLQSAAPLPKARKPEPPRHARRRF